MVINNLNAEIFQWKGFLADCVVPDGIVINGACPLIGLPREEKHSTSFYRDRVETLVKSGGFSCLHLTFIYWAQWTGLVSCVRQLKGKVLIELMVRKRFYNYTGYHI